MEPVFVHAWDLSEAEALELQCKSASKVVREDDLGDVGHVAGVDVAYDETRHRQLAAAVVLAADSLEVVEYATGLESGQFPYVPGLFSFRELPAIARALQRLKTIPDLIVCDGHGIAHPRRFGLASHLGVMFDIPAIGCSKTRLVGQAREPGSKRGDRAPLRDKGEVIGCVLRTRENVKPVYVSTGHRVSLETACAWILRLTLRYRLPETTRQADRIVRRWKKG